MPSFCAAFNCSNCADRDKDKSNYRFPGMLKIMVKKPCNFPKCGRQICYLKFSGNN